MTAREEDRGIWLAPEWSGLAIEAEDGSLYEVGREHGYGAWVSQGMLDMVPDHWVRLVPVREDNHTPAPVPFEQHERAVTEEIERRDEAEEWADKLAAELAPAHVVGEHSLKNHPWRNALEWAQSAGQTREVNRIDQIRAVLAEIDAVHPLDFKGIPSLGSVLDRLRAILDSPTPARRVWFPGDTVPDGTIVLDGERQISTAYGDTKLVNMTCVEVFGIPSFEEWQAAVDRARAERDGQTVAGDA